MAQEESSPGRLSSRPIVTSSLPRRLTLIRGGGHCEDPIFVVLPTPPNRSRSWLPDRPPAWVGVPVCRSSNKPRHRPKYGSSKRGSAFFSGDELRSELGLRIGPHDGQPSRRACRRTTTSSTARRGGICRGRSHRALTASSRRASRLGRRPFFPPLRRSSQPQ